MKYVKRSVFGLVLAALLFSLCAVPALAADDTVKTVDVIYFEDGSYLTVELTEQRTPLTRTTYSVTGSKTGYYNNSSGELMWTFTVRGTFSYNGTTSSATSASYSYTIEDSTWKFISGSAYCSGNQAIAEGHFRCALILNRYTTLTLTCDANGNLS